MIGRTIGNYRIVEKVGEGGMGTVFRATELLVERDVAIKVLRSEYAQNPELNERFRTEAVALARLNHPAIATLYSFFQDGAELFMAMEFVPGETLEKRIQRQGAMPWPQAVEVLLWSLDAVRHAHQMGILHRDLKPANIMITPDGRVKVTDFGIARVLNSVKLTREARIVGTVEYLAPERAMGKPADARSDLYSLGVVFYEMLIGRVPFEADSDVGLLRAQIEQVPVCPKDLGVDVPVEVERALMKVLAKDPEERFPDASTFAAAFREAVRSTGMPLGSRPTRLAGGDAPPADAKVSKPPSWGVRVTAQAQGLWNTVVQTLGRQYAVAAVSALGTFVMLGLIFLGIHFALRIRPEPPPPVVAQDTPAEPQPVPFTGGPLDLQPIAPPVTLPTASSPASPPPSSVTPSPAQTPRPAQGPSAGTRPEKPALGRDAVLAVLEERDPGAAAVPGSPIHYPGLLKAIRSGGAAATPWIVEVIERRGVNFRPTPAQTAELRAAGAAEALLTLVAGAHRGEAPPAPVAPAPATPAPPPVSEASAPPKVTPKVRRLSEVRRLGVEAAEPELRNFLFQELEGAFRGRLNIIRSGPADAVLRVKLEEEGGNKVVGAAGRVFGMRGKVRAVAEIAEARDGVVLWQSVAGDRSFGGLGNGARRVASRVAKQLKDDWQN